MKSEIRDFIRSQGEELSPPMIQATQRFFAARFAGIHPGTLISRDHPYGPDARHRLDVFTAQGRRDAPVLVFVHGGGFVMGDKRSPDLPFYDNVGDFAVQAGCIGVTMTYRLAPAHPWPAGSEDVAAAVRWLQAHVAEHGGDPQRIFLMGQSAGAVHVAGCVAHSASRAGPGIAGALLISGSYDVAQADANPFHLAYYGEDSAAWPACSTLEALCATELPLFFTVSEFDAADFHKQAALLVAAWARTRRRFPRLHWLAGHNHLSPVQAIGSPADTLGPLIRDFLAVAGR
ncbi:MAG TPA: alpha/beta hydrolase [Steroidobacteraceae bacterium]|nr:alpha/beta hydrolase [Steroidobacteraceae bacterium]